MRSHLPGLILLLSAILFAGSLCAQDKANFLDLDRPRKFFIVPAVYYKPETNWSFGFVSAKFFRFSKKDTISPLSRVALGFAYTLNDQILSSVPFQLFIAANRYIALGEVSFYRFPYFYAGTGNEVPTGFYETYSAQFPRIYLTAMRRLVPKLYTGPKYFFQNTTMMEYEEGGELQRNIVSGSTGSVLHGFGWQIRWDQRNHIYAPTKGFYAESYLLGFDRWAMSSHDFNEYLIDLRAYFPLNKHVIAIQGLAELQYGDVPFNRLSSLGGDRFMRGYTKGQYRDKMLVQSSIEYRSPMWKKIGFAAFLGIGGVAPSIKEYEMRFLLPSYGAGIRLRMNEKERLNLRFDYARGLDTDNFYLTVGEAF
jgi:hypothetical protein